MKMKYDTYRVASFGEHTQLLHLLTRQLTFREWNTSIIFEMRGYFWPFFKPLPVGVSTVCSNFPLQLTEAKTIHLTFQEVRLLVSHPCHSRHLSTGGRLNVCHNSACGDTYLVFF